jgi:signal peptidase I
MTEEVMMPKYGGPTLALFVEHWPSMILLPAVLLLLVVLAVITRWWDLQDQSARERPCQAHSPVEVTELISDEATAVGDEATAVAPEALGNGPPDPKRETPSGGRSRRNAVLVVVGLLLMALAPAFVARIYVIPTGSMERTLHGCPGCDNDRVLVDKFAYRFALPSRGDVVVFALPDSWTSAELQTQHDSANPVVNQLRQLGSLFGVKAADETYIKRVIAVSGQTVACCDERNRILVEETPVDEPYLYFLPDAGPPQQAPFGPVRVPEGHLWVMGDSRNDSVDSRSPGNGPIPVANLIGQARFILWPFDRLGGINDTTPQGG